MVEKGDWIVPRLLDEPFLDKPILYFWTIAASLKTLGMSEAAVRLPGLLFGMLGMPTTVAIAWRMLGRRTGLIAGAGGPGASRFGRSPGTPLGALADQPGQIAAPPAKAASGAARIASGFWPRAITGAIW